MEEEVDRGWQWQPGRVAAGGAPDLLVTEQDLEPAGEVEFASMETVRDDIKVSPGGSRTLSMSASLNPNGLQLNAPIYEDEEKGQEEQEGRRRRRETKMLLI
jgi:hypothetical protein